jgi:hypothetical protein
MNKTSQSNLSETVTSKSGLIGFLQGNIKGALNTLSYSEESSWVIITAIKQLEAALVESEEIWNRVKSNV